MSRCSIMTDQVAAYDPRDPAQSLADPETWKPTRNPALIAAKMAMDQPVLRSPSWTEVARAADFCDETVPVPPAGGSHEST